jgi:hypothetical protein
MANRTNWSDDFWNRPPDFTHGDAEMLASGELVDLVANNIDVTLNNIDVTRMSKQLADELAKYLDGFGHADKQVSAVLRFIAAGARDTAGEGESAGVLFESPGHLTVWFHRTETGWTAMLPEDY